jgi:signal transduction histidine kinase
MSRAILTVQIRFEQDAVLTRQRARQIARLLGFDAQDQTRIATAVSEIARNAFRYAGGGKAEFSADEDGRLLVIKVSDTGPGIPGLQAILDGRYNSKTGMGLGIIGSKRICDRFDVRTSRGSGTIVTMAKFLPGGTVATPERLALLTEQLSKQSPLNAYTEVQQQNQELLQTLEALRIRQAEVEQLNRQLAENNRGVIALNAELDDKAEALRRASELKTKFLSQMTHELRTPLNSIVMLSRMLSGGADGPLNEEQGKQAAFIRKSSEGLLDMVNDLLDLAKIEAGKTDVRVTEFTVPNLFGALRGIFRPVIDQQSGITLILDPSDHLPLLQTDEIKVAQILRNLISNGIKFTERGEVRVWADARTDEGSATFFVSDTGPGISPDDQAKLFQDFTQLDSVARKGFRGTGLGLSLSRELAGLLGGRLEVSSHMGMGSTFSLNIPMVHPNVAARPDAEDARKAEHAR